MGAMRPRDNGSVRACRRRIKGSIARSVHRRSGSQRVLSKRETDVSKRLFLGINGPNLLYDSASIAIALLLARWMRLAIPYGIRIDSTASAAWFHPALLVLVPSIWAALLVLVHALGRPWVSELTETRVRPILAASVTGISLFAVRVMLLPDLSRLLIVYSVGVTFAFTFAAWRLAAHRYYLRSQTNQLQGPIAVLLPSHWYRISTNVDRLIPWIVLAIAAVLRLHHLGRDSLWLDEIDTVTLVSLPFREMLAGLQYHVSPPLDYIILYSVTRLGSGDGLVRLPAALWGTLAVYFIYRAGRLLGGRLVGLSSSLLLTFSLSAIAYSQEARMYSLFLALTSLLIWCASAILECPESLKRWAAATIVGTMLIYTHYYGALVLLGLGLLWLGVCATHRGPGLITRGAASFTVIGVAFAPWIPSLVEQATRRAGVLSYSLERNAYWNTVLALGTGGTAQTHQLAYLGVFLLGIVVCARKRPVAAGLMIAVTAVPLLIAYTVPQLAETITPRNLLFFVPGYLLVIAIGLSGLSRGILLLIRRRSVASERPMYLSSWLPIVSLTALALVPSFGLLREHLLLGRWWMKDSRSGWRQTAELLQQQMAPGDLVLSANRYDRFLLSYYLDPVAIDGRQLDPFVQDESSVHSGSSRYVPFLTLEARPQEMRRAVASAPSTWLVGTDPKALASLSRAGIRWDHHTVVTTTESIPLVRLGAATLAEYPSVSASDSDAFDDGWSDDVYLVDTKPVRWMSSPAASLRLPTWDDEARLLHIDMYVPSHRGDATVHIFANGMECQAVNATPGWQTLEIALPTGVALDEGDVRVDLQIAGLEPVVASSSIGTTGVLSPVPIVAESSGSEGRSFAAIYVDDSTYSWYRAGKGYARGYNMVALDPSTGQLLGWEAFDTCIDPGESDRMLAWVEGLPDGAIVAGAIKDDGSSNLTDSGVKALHLLGCQVDVRCCFRSAHAFAAVKGALPGTALEVGPALSAVAVVGSDPRDYSVAVGQVILRKER